MILIDAMPIKKFIENGLNCKDQLKAFGHDAIEILTEIEFAPVVDAVEVVRCKNCLHAREKNEYERNYLVDEVLICTSPDATDDCWNPVWPKHWCSYGERRADDGK